MLSIMPKIQMERSVSVSSDRNIRDHLWRGLGGGPLISVGIFRPKFVVPHVLTNRFFAVIREFRNLVGRFNRKISFHFPRVFPLISDRSV